MSSTSSDDGKDPFSCFGGGESASSDDDVPEDDGERKIISAFENHEQGRRLRQAANARQSCEKEVDRVPIAGGTNFVVYSCADAVGYGPGQLGVRALRPFSAGEEILRESPAMKICTSHAAASREEAEEKFETAVDEAFDALTPRSAAAVMDLSSCNQQGGSDEGSNNKNPQGIFRTNSYQLGKGTDYGGLFLTVSRMNHSCRPNASHHWRPDMHQMMVFASRDIAVGDEICTCYGPGDYRNTEGRRAFLRDRYSFECSCQMCREGNDMGGDDRMTAIGLFHDTIELSMTSRPEEAIKRVDRCLEQLKAQGIGNPKGPYVQPVLHYGYQICLFGLHDEVRAHSYLSRELLSVQSSEGHGSYKAIDLRSMCATT